jgi:catechol 2,3-dioxygenase-like lactoylglutathione lyase family enzyme
MLGETNATATVAVKNLQAAAKFYEGTLGLKRTADVDGGAYVYETGSTTLLVYVSQFAGTNQATSVTWTVGEYVDNIVRDLKSKGVAFEHYDLPETKREGDLHISGSRRVAWFKDPDGNIHALVNG